MELNRLNCEIIILILNYYEIDIGILFTGI